MRRKGMIEIAVKDFGITTETATVIYNNNPNCFYKAVEEHKLKVAKANREKKRLEEIEAEKVRKIKSKTYIPISLAYDFYGFARSSFRTIIKKHKIEVTKRGKLQHVKRSDIRNILDLPDVAKYRNISKNIIEGKCPEMESVTEAAQRTGFSASIIGSWIREIEMERFYLNHVMQIYKKDIDNFIKKFNKKTKPRK